MLLADDHDVVRQGFRLVLGTQPDLEVVGEAADGREAIEQVRRLRPDLVLMDVTMPVMDGLEATRRIKEEMPGVCVLMFTSHEEPEYLLEAIEAGAAGYVLKDAPVSRLIGAIRRASGGESPLDQELAARLIRGLSEKAGGARREAPAEGSVRRPPAEHLTRRELEVLGLMAQGRTNPQIARELVIARPTAKTHVERVIRKLGVSDRTQAVVRAIDLGLVGTETS
ncbi:MAG TPA: response regulator transcription factor [Rubrobacter sp.]|nr:response regulator transcription factor [Rubrobacter sp.]